MPSPTGSTRSRRPGDPVSLLPVVVVALALATVAHMGSAGAPVDAGAPVGDVPVEGRGRSWAALVDEVGDGRLSGTVLESRVALDVPEAARQALLAYEEQGLVLVESGYLDLRGEAWGCVVWSGSWSEVCLVRGSPGDAGSVVRVMRIEGSGWEERDG